MYGGVASGKIDEEWFGRESRKDVWKMSFDKVGKNEWLMNFVEPDKETRGEEAME